MWTHELSNKGLNNTNSAKLREKARSNNQTKSSNEYQARWNGSVLKTRNETQGAVHSNVN